MPESPVSSSRVWDDLFRPTLPSRSSAFVGEENDHSVSGGRIGRAPSLTISTRNMDADTFSKLVNGDRVHIYVGSSRQHWNLPQKLLCHHSPFFEKAFTGNFKEGIKKSIELKEDDVAAFKLLVHWMFTNTIDKPKPIHKGGYFTRPRLVPANSEVEAKMLNEEDSMGVVSDNAGNDVAENISATSKVPSPWKRFYLGMWVYARLYVLADKLGMVGLQDETLELLRDGTVHYLHPEIVIWIYQNTLPASPLRKCATSLASSALLLKYVTPTYFNIISARCDDFVNDLIQTLVREGEEVIYSRQPFRDQYCGLHVHTAGDACPQVKPAFHEEDHRVPLLSSQLRYKLQRVWDNVLGRCSHPDREMHTLRQVRSTLLKALAQVIDERSSVVRAV